MRNPNMAKRYTAEFRQQMVELLLSSGRTAAQLGREFGCTGWSIRHWAELAQAHRQGGAQGAPAASAGEREELERLRRENAQLRVEREILAKAAAWFAQETVTSLKRSSDS